MNRILIIIFIFLNVVIVLFFSLRLNSEYENNVKCKQRAELLSDSLVNFKEVLLSANLIKSNYIENTIITNTINNQYGPIINIIRKNNNNDVLIIRLLNTNCGSCKLKQAEMIKALEYKRPIVLSYTGETRKLILYMKANKIDVPIFQISPEYKILPEDDTSKILIMVVSKEGAIKKAYFLDVDNMFMANYMIIK